MTFCHMGGPARYPQGAPPRGRVSPLPGMGGLSGPGGRFRLHTKNLKNPEKIWALFFSEKAIKNSGIKIL